MTPDVLSALVNIGSSGAVIATVLIFIAFIKERDALFEKRNTSLVDAVDRLAQRIQEMQVFDARHDASMLEAIKDMRTARNGGKKERTPDE